MTSHNRNYSLNALVDRPLNARLELLVQSDNVGCSRKRRYTKTHDVATLAVEKFKTSGKGITFNDLMLSGLAKHKSQAQNTLKRYLAKKVLFVIKDHKPQHYFAASLKAEIFKARLSKNAPVGVTEVPFSQSTHNDTIIMQTLEDYILPILRDIPIHIHKIQLRLEIRSQ
ncbi:MAG: hypothetical protein ACREAS_03905, partial [Nitrososphaera sp.]